ncbi:MAG: hypothetical protein RL624_1128 [Bacteroidota bacterium]|jgi:hypothetical protein
MKNTLLAALVAFLFMTSCTQQNTPSPSNNNNGGGSTTLYAIDQSYFFKINFQNKALSNYAVFTTASTGSVSFQAGPYTTNSFGGLVTQTVNGVISTQFGFISHPLDNALINHSTVKLQFYLEKAGAALGTYTKKSLQNIPTITDLTTSKTYNIDTSSLNFNVSNVGVHNVTGTFTCKLIDGTALIPASGTFNLYKL